MIPTQLILFSLNLQERSGAYGHHMCEEVETLSQNFGNVYVTATKLGKLRKQTYEHFLKNVEGMSYMSVKQTVVF